MRNPSCANWKLKESQGATLRAARDARMACPSNYQRQTYLENDQ